MKVIHVIWEPLAYSGKLHFWAENAALYDPDRTNSSRFHPFSCPQLELLEILSGFFNDKEPWELSSIDLSLPTFQGQPLPSNDLSLLEDYALSADDVAISMDRWQIKTIALRPEDVSRHLLKLSKLSAADVRWGQSLFYWQAIWEFVLELLAKQSFLPAAQWAREYIPPKLLALWKPYFSYEDHQVFLRLVTAMPHVCSSVFCSEQSELMSAHDINLNAVTVLMDHFIRMNIKAENILPYRMNTVRKQAPPAEKWLKALFASRSEIMAKGTELDQIYADVSEWLEIINQNANIPFRICFKLHPPKTTEEIEQEIWILEFYIQSHRDLSLMLPMKKYWKQQDQYRDILSSSEKSANELLLEFLEKGAKYFPKLKESLVHGLPTHLFLNTEEAYQFLRNSVPVLEMCGFGIWLPSWWKRPQKRLGVKLHLLANQGGDKTSRYIGLDTIVNYDWKVALGDQVLTQEELQKLIELKQPLVNIRGEWLELKVEEIEKAIAYFQKREHQSENKLGYLLAMALGQEESDTGLMVTGIDEESEGVSFIHQLSREVDLEQIPQPEGFKGDLRPYQQTGLSWLVFLERLRLGACLADDMGLGKTIQIIALILHSASKDPTLIVAPMSVISNWKNEIERFAPNLKVLIHHGVDRYDENEFAELAPQYHVVITTYALVSQEMTKLSKVHWHRIVLDEAQNIKNTYTKQTQAVKQLKSSCKIALTGTPLENRLSELWSIMDFINPSYLSSQKVFRQKYAIPIERFRDSEQSELLKKVIRPFILRRVKTDKKIIKDLPQKIETKQPCYLTPEQIALYQSVVRQMMTRIEKEQGIQRRGLILSALMKLKQICNHPAQFLQDNSSLGDRSGKLTRLKDLLDEVLAEGDKALVFTQFSQMGQLLKRHLQQTLNQEVLFLYGASTKTQRDQMIERFQSQENGPKIFILSLKAGGIGLNLTSANHVFHFDRWWNPAIENQATDRAFRIGQDKAVFVHKFICKGTVEERIDRMIDRKKELTDLVVDHGENWITELSTEELRELFELNLEEQ